jgi:two-component system, NtrC family, response regulator GlrR
MKNHSPPLTASLGFGVDVNASMGRKTGGLPAKMPSCGARILLVDEDPALRRLMMTRLGAANYQVESVDCARAALNACARWRPHLVITALRMQPMDGLGLLRALKHRWQDLSVIILTAYGTIPDAVRATQCGAFGFLVKPIEKAELLGQVRRAILASPFTYVQGDWRADIVSRSQLMEDRLAQANRAARSDVAVLLSGENGTGRELFARAIHAASGRREKSFIIVSCTHREEKLLEAELFGDDRQTGAGESGVGGGSLHAARGGTLLLDEVGNLPLRVQVRLVGALREDNEGGGHGGGAEPTNVRLLCSTSGDLKRLLAIGRFHEDLYYRVSLLTIEVPPLGRRREDIPLLVSCFLEQAAEEGGTGKIYSPQAVQMLMTADWPGNVRQLFDLVRRNVAQSQDRVMSGEFVERSLGSAASQLPSFDDARDQFARDYLSRSLKSTSGNVSQSARLAKRNRTDFYKLLMRYRLHPDEYKENRLRMATKSQKYRGRVRVPG